MWASAVIEAEISADARTNLEHCFIDMKIDLLIFDRPSEPFDEDIVSSGTPAVYRYGDFNFFCTVEKSTEVNCEP